MSDQNVCPYCGGDVIAGFVEFRGVQGYQAQCKKCGAKGSVLVVASEIWHIEILEAFTHPAHLLKDKALVDVDDLREVLNILEDANNPAIDRLWAQMREGEVK